MESKPVELRGPFNKGQELLGNYSNIKKLSVFGKVSNYVTINDEEFELGKTGMLEIQNTWINSLFFNQDEDELTHINFII